MLRALTFSVVLSLSVSAFAGILNTTVSDRKFEGIALASSASVQLADQKVDLGFVGAGLRTKKVLIAQVRVYVLQMFTEAPARFVRTVEGALNSTDDLNTVALQLSFLRSVEANTVQTSFRDALQANKVDLNSPAIKTFLNAVSTGGDAASGKSLTIVLHRKSDGSEQVSYEDTAGHLNTITGEKGFIHAILSIWLGQPADDGVATLRNQLIKG